MERGQVEYSAVGKPYNAGSSACPDQREIIRAMPTRRLVILTCNLIFACNFYRTGAAVGAESDTADFLTA